VIPEPAGAVRRGLVPVARFMRRSLVAARKPALHKQLIHLRDSGTALTLVDAERLAATWSISSGAEPALLVDLARRAAAAHGPILECGSGLTTLVASVYAAHGLWALEHHPRYGAAVERSLRKCGLAERGNVVLATIKPYSDFDWYAVPSGLPQEPFVLVICDGPPSETRGGRIGLLHIMRDRLAPGATILLDDAQRPMEQQVLKTWQDEYGVRVLYQPRTRYAIVTTADAATCDIPR
jgi:hypothetical protein